MTTEITEADRERLNEMMTRLSAMPVMQIKYMVEEQQKIWLETIVSHRTAAATEAARAERERIVAYLEAMASVATSGLARGFSRVAEDIKADRIAGTTAIAAENV